MSDWGKVPKEVFLDKRLTRRDLRVFGFVCASADGRTGLCRVKQETIAKEIETDRVGVLRSLKKLVELGYLEASKPAGMRRSLNYRVLIRDAVAGQMSLFDAIEAPRHAKSKAKVAPKKGGRAATSESSQTATSDVALEATTDVAPMATSIEQTLINRTEPAGSAAARDRKEPANDRIAMVVALPDLGELSEAMFQAAGSALHPQALDLKAMTIPVGWIGAGCDLQFDILPAVAALAARRRGSQIRSWAYFRSAVFEARDKRLAGIASAGPLPDRPSHPHASDRPAGRRDPEPRHGDRYEQPSRSAPVDGGGRFAAAAARRRREISGGAPGGPPADDLAGPVLLPPGSRTDR